MLGTSLLWRSTVAFTYLKVKLAKCLCLLPVILVLVLLFWSWSCLKNLVLYTSLINITISRTRRVMCALVLLQQRRPLLGGDLRQRGADLFDDDVRQRVQPQGPQRQGAQRRVVVGRPAPGDVRRRRSGLRVGRADRPATGRERAQVVLVQRRSANARRQDHVRRRLRSHAERNLRLAGKLVDVLWTAIATLSAGSHPCYAVVVITMIRLRYDGRSTAVRLLVIGH